MAVISQLPTPEVVRAYKGTLDFYFHRGQYHVRSWPRSPSAPRSPAVLAAAQAFATLAKALPTTHPLIINGLNHFYNDTAWTWKDAATSGQYGHAIVLE